MSITAAAIGAGLLGVAGQIGGAAIQGAWQQKLNDQQYAYNTREANRQRQFAHDEAILQRQFEERLSNTAYQRSVADMKKAGFNPAMLSGSGATTPAGATAQGVAASGSAGNAPDLSGLGAGIGSVFNSASNALLNKAARDKDFALKLAQAQKAEVLQAAQMNYLNSAATLNQVKAGYSPLYSQKLNEDIQRQLQNLL